MVKDGHLNELPCMCGLGEKTDLMYEGRGKMMTNSAWNQLEYILQWVGCKARLPMQIKNLQ